MRILTMLCNRNSTPRLQLQICLSEDFATVHSTLDFLRRSSLLESPGSPFIIDTFSTCFYGKRAALSTGAVTNLEPLNNTSPA